MPDRDRVLDRAIELWEKDRGAKSERDEQEAIEAAAQELGVPAEYIDKASESLAAEEHGRRRSRVLLLKAAVVLVALVIGGLSLQRVLSPPIPMADGPWRATFDDTNGWAIVVNPGTLARYDVLDDVERGRVARLEVDRFEWPADGRFYANLRADPPPETLGGYTHMRLWVRGEGLHALRVYPRNGSERWRSPEIEITPEWQEHVIELRRFEHQVGSRGNWRSATWQPPGALSRLQLKVGYFMNDVTSVGYVKVDDLRFE